MQSITYSSNFLFVNSVSGVCFYIFFLTFSGNTYLPPLPVHNVICGGTGLSIFMLIGPFSDKSREMCSIADCTSTKSEDLHLILSIEKIIKSCFTFAILAKMELLAS